MAEEGQLEGVVWEKVAGRRKKELVWCILDLEKRLVDVAGMGAIGLVHCLKFGG